MVIIWQIGAFIFPEYLVIDIPEREVRYINKQNQPKPSKSNSFTYNPNKNGRTKSK